MKRVPLLVLFACLAGLLSACGGGGGGTAPPLNLSIDLTTLPAATVNTPYNETVAMTASGGTSPYLYSCTVSNGTGLKASVSSAGSTTGGALCSISGTPLTPGAVTLNFSVSDSTNASVSSAGPLSVNISDPLANWHWRNPLPQGNSLRAVAYGNGMFVTVGSQGTILSSPDGISWAARASGTAAGLNGVTYGNGIFIVVGDAGTILTSPDGLNWSTGSSGISATLESIAYGNGVFVAVGHQGSGFSLLGIMLTSTDGINWVAREPGTSNLLKGATYGTGTFVVVGQEGTIVTSQDGVKWIRRASGITPNHWQNGMNLNGVTYGNGIFVAVSGADGRRAPTDSGMVLTSKDGVSWNHVSLGTDYYFFGVDYKDGIFVAVGIFSNNLSCFEVCYISNESGIIFTSIDGANWIQRPVDTQSLNGITHGNKSFVAVGDNGMILQSDPLSGN